MKKLTLKKSLALWKRAEQVIPAGTQLFSKSPRAYVYGAYPMFIDHAKGAYVWDVDGNKYIDYNMGYGPAMLGYANRVVDEAVHRQLKKGTAFSLLNAPMVEVAELLVKHIPSAEMVRFGKHGSDVTAMAVRCARSVTGREKIAFCGYHGWQDWFVASSKLNYGIPKVMSEFVLPFEYNKPETLQKLFDENPGQIAGVILEPTHSVLPKDNFLQKVKDIAHKNGALVIFDEVITGFRFGIGGAQKYFGVTPDLSTFGKAIANGLPLSALLGKREYMMVFDFNRTFYSSTFGDEPVSLAAALATLNTIIKKPVAKHIWRLGKKLQSSYNKLAEQYHIPTALIGSPAELAVEIRLPQEHDQLVMKSLLLQETAKRGVCYGLLVLISYAHTDRDIQYTLRATEEAFRVMRVALDSGKPEQFLEGKVMEVVRL